MKMSLKVVSRTSGKCMTKALVLSVMLLSTIMLQSPVFSESYSQDGENSSGFITADEINNIDVYKKASPSVVFVTNTAYRRTMFSLNVMEIPQGSGSGFIWNKTGLIVTNFHVIQSASKITIHLQDHSSWDAEVVGLAPDKDLAVLRINAPAEKLQPLPLGSSDQLEIGRKVLAIGNPFGLDTTLTVGVVSALDREIKSVTQRKIKGVIQTDAAINPGNSGGPLLNSSGELIGVNAAIYSPSGANAGIGFAIPVNTVKDIVPQLIQYGKVYRPVLGIETASDSWARYNSLKGVAIINVQSGSGASKAGLQGVTRNRHGEWILGDVIVAIEGNKILNNDDLLSVLEKHNPGDKVQITLRNKKNKRKVIIRLSEPD